MHFLGDLPYKLNVWGYFASFLGGLFIMATPIQAILLIWEHKGLRGLLKPTPFWGPQDTRIWYGRYRHLRADFVGVKKDQRVRKKKAERLLRDRRGLKG